MAPGQAFAQAEVALSVSSKVVPHVLVFKIKDHHKPIARLNGVQSEVLNRALSQVAARRVVRKFPELEAGFSLRACKPQAVDLSLIYEMEYGSQLSFEKAKKLLEATGMVSYVEPLYYWDVLVYPNDPMADSVSGSQYYLKNIHAYQAWQVERGDSNVVIGIVDTGIRFSHEDLGQKIKYNYADPIDGIDNDGDGYVDNFRGWDTADNDNDPSADHFNWGPNGHGVAIAGVAAAQTHNRKGIAGVGYNTPILPIKAYSSKTGGRFGGYEGILYAAHQGCKVINLSWGGAGSPSAYEQDIINYAAINKDVVLVAAAGNTFGELNFYPASYDHVLSVGMTDQDDVKVDYSTFSYKIDLVAPGAGIMTTTHVTDSSYGRGNGTSFAAPAVAGAAALVRSRFPHLNALQVAELLRVTADPIDHLPGNQPYREKLGSGRLNMYRALTETQAKAVRNTSVRISDGRQTYPGQTFALLADFTNYLTPTANLVVTLSSPSPYVTVGQNTFRAGALPTLGTRTNNTQPFTVKIADNIPSNEKVLFRLGYQDGSYTDFQYFDLTLNQDLLTVEVNKLVVSINSKGNFGYDGMDFTRGVGVRYKGGLSLLTEGGLMVGTSTTKVSDNIRNEHFKTDYDFFSLENIKPSPLSTADQFRAGGLLRDSANTRFVGVLVNQQVYAWSETLDQKYVILEYTLTNITKDTLTNLHASLFADWDILNPFKNVADWDSENNLGYVYNAEFPSVFAGLKLLTGQANYFAAEAKAGGDGTVSLDDGFTTYEKFTSMSSGTRYSKAGQTGAGDDVWHVVGRSFPALPPQEKAVVSFALLAGDNLPDLQNSAKAAQARYDALRAEQVLSAGPKEPADRMIRVFPNPTGGSLQIDLPPSFLAGEAATVEVFSLIGNRLQHQTLRQAGSLSLDLSSYANGMYIVRMTSSQGVVVRKVQLRR